MQKISESVVKKDHMEKMNGSALYVGDFAKDEDVYYGKLVRSTVPHAELKEIRYPDLPEGYYSVDWRDVPGENAVHIVQDDTPVFAEKTVEFIGDPVAMIIGPDEKEAERLAAETEIICNELPPIFDIDDSETVFFDYHYGHGDIDAAFAEADKIYDEKFETGYQEQAYLEPQGMIGCAENGGMTIHGSLQCPYYVHGAIAQCLGIGRDKVRIIQDYTGGGFGGKEAFPSILAAQTAVAAWKTGKKVRVIFERREDMEFTSKRHPSRSHYRVAVKGGKITGIEADVRFNAGAYTTLTPVVLQRGIIAAPGVYDIPAVKVHGKALKTNLVPCGAFRGFGAPQTFFAIEMIMSHIARDMGIEPLAFKDSMLVKKGDLTSTNGLYHYPVPLLDMVKEVENMSGYSKKRKEYAKSQTGRYRKGIGIALWFHGAGFTGSGERDFIKAVVAIRKDRDGRVEVLAANSDIGQGIKTTFCKIVASELGLPLDKVYINNPDTSIVPDSGPTVASRSLMVVGELLRRAAGRLKSEWKDGEEQRIEERFVEPDFMLPFDLSIFNGDAYPTYSWGVGAVELQIDTLTGENEVLGSWNSFDIGTPIDMNISIGQMEGGVLQGLGYASMEQMAADAKGRIRNKSYSDYIVPTSKDLETLEVKMHVEEYPYGPYGAKGAGELPLVGIAPAFCEAAEQAIGNVSINHIPLTAEETLELLAKAGKEVA